MSILCKACDRSIFENESEYNEYLFTLRKRNNKTYTINNINLDEVNNLLNDYISTHNKTFDFCFIIL